MHLVDIFNAHLNKKADKNKNTTRIVATSEITLLNLKLLKLLIKKFQSEYHNKIIENMNNLIISML